MTKSTQPKRQGERRISERNLLYDIASQVKTDEELALHALGRGSRLAPAQIRRQAVHEGIINPDGSVNNPKISLEEKVFGRVLRAISNPVKVASLLVLDGEELTQAEIRTLVAEKLYSLEHKLPVRSVFGTYCTDSFMPAELIEQNQKRIKGHSNSAAYSISERGRAVGIPCAVHYVEHYFENNDLMLKIFDTAGSVSQLTSSYNRFRALEALQQGESTAWQNHFRIPLPWNTTKHHLENLTSSGYTQRKGKMYSITPKGMKAIEFGQEIRRIVKRGLKAQGREVFEIEREARRSQSRVGFEETLTRAVTDYLQKQNGGRKSGRVKLEDAKKAVMHYLTENATEQGIGRHAIANSLGYKRTTAETALRELTKEGNIVRQKNIFGKVNYLPRV